VVILAFVVSEYPAGDLEFTVDEIAGGGFYEEERFLWDCVVQLLDMVDVVSTDCDDLNWRRMLVRERGRELCCGVPSFLASRTRPCWKGLGNGGEAGRAVVWLPLR
jgi:hypothetical protein